MKQKILLFGYVDRVTKKDVKKLYDFIYNKAIKGENYFAFCTSGKFADVVMEAYNKLKIEIWNINLDIFITDYNEKVFNLLSEINLFNVSHRFIKIESKNKLSRFSEILEKMIIFCDDIFVYCKKYNELKNIINLYANNKHKIIT